MENTSISGFQFLCEILGNMYVSSDEKTMLRIHFQNHSPMEKDKLKVIQGDFSEFAYQLKCNRGALLDQMDDLVGYCYKGVSVDSFFDDVRNAHDKNNYSKSLESMFRSLLHDQVGTSNVAFAGIAVTVVLAAGYAQNAKFYVGSQEVRTILTKSMEILGYHNTAFIPDSFFEIKDGNMDHDLLRLLLLSLLGALKVKYPHKKTDVAQIIRNAEKARETIDGLISSNQTSSLFGALRSSGEVSRICEGMVEAMKDDAQWVSFPNGKTLPLDSFYRIPGFEIIGKGTGAILLSDYHSSIRSLVIGKTGSGKSLLTKAIVRTCLEPPASRNGVFEAYANVLGLYDQSYLPLVLDCKALPQDEKLEKLDLIEEAVNQLVRLTRTSGYASCLAHWNAFSARVVEYFRQKARDSALLLIVEDISWLDRNSSEALLKKLRRMECTEYSRLHILVVTQRLVVSQMMHFNHYNCVEIAPLSFSLDKEIRKLVDLGVAVSTAENYLSLINSNRRVRSFVDTPEHLIKLLCHPYKEPFDLDALLWQTIDEHIERHYCAYVADSDCREFLTALAVSVAESKNRARLSRLSSAMDHQNIPKNIVAKGYLASLVSKISQPDIVWQSIMDNMILVYPNSGISSYAFVNPMFYCSLVADYYIQQIGTQPMPNWLDRFNRLSSEDFSAIIVMLFNRLSKNPSDDTAPLEVSNYDILILLQSVVGYIASQSDPVGLHYSLLALQDMLTNEQLRSSLHRNLWQMLEQAYSNNYSRFIALTDDFEKIKRLMNPESIPNGI